jgi:hypothetical protein
MESEHFPPPHPAHSARRTAVKWNRGNNLDGISAPAAVVVPEERGWNGDRRSYCRYTAQRSDQRRGPDGNREEDRAGIPSVQHGTPGIFQTAHPIELSPGWSLIPGCVALRLQGQSSATVSYFYCKPISVSVYRRRHISSKTHTISSPPPAAKAHPHRSTSAPPAPGFHYANSESYSRFNFLFS